MNQDSQSTTPDRPGEGGRAVVLLSGGLDSATALAIANAAGYETFALSVRYGQRHAGELAAARRVAEALGVTNHLEIGVDLGAIGGSALTADIPVPHAAGSGPHEDGTARDAVRSDEDEQEIPVTYVPARNTVFLSLALAWAEVLEAEHIFIGVNAVDYSGYPDCRPEFVEAFERLAGLATRAGVSGRPLHIHTPLIAWSKARIIARGMELGVDYALTTSCYAPAPDGAACGDCDACALRRAGFLEAGVPDPIRYTPGSAI